MIFAHFKISTRVRSNDHSTVFGISTLQYELTDKMLLVTGIHASRGIRSRVPHRISQKSQKNRLRSRSLQQAKRGASRAGNDVEGHSRSDPRAPVPRRAETPRTRRKVTMQ